MNRLSILIACAAMLLASQTAYAQRSLPRYEPPYGPTLSPYLLFSQRPLGGYDNYNAFIRPRFELRSTLRTQNGQLLQLNRNVRDVQRDVRTLSTARDSGVAPTGTGSSYFNYSHYYPTSRGRR